MCLENIKKLYKTAGKCDNQHHYKAILESAMVSTPEGSTDNSLMTPNPSVSNKNPSAIKSLHQFSETLDVKHKTAVRRLGAAKAKCKAIKTGNVLWSNITKRRGHKKINQEVREDLYHWIIHHPQVVKSLIANDCIYVSIDGNSEKKLMPKLLLQVSVREIHNSMVSPQEEGGLKEARDGEHNIIISDSTFFHLN